MKKICLLSMLCMMLLISGCAKVSVTKTAKGFFAATDPADVEILVTVPDRQAREFVELASVTTSNWDTNATAKMHNSLRAKCAPLGAHAVILSSSGIDYNGDFWASGVAIRYKD